MEKTSTFFDRFSLNLDCLRHMSIQYEKKIWFYLTDKLRFLWKEKKKLLLFNQEKVFFNEHSFEERY